MYIEFFMLIFKFNSEMIFDIICVCMDIFLRFYENINLVCVIFESLSLREI